MNTLVTLLAGPLGGFTVTAVLAILVFPRTVLDVLLLAFTADSPRRRELRAEYEHIPWKERPGWVVSLIELAVREGLVDRSTRLVAELLIRPVFRSQTIRDSLFEMLADVPPLQRPYWAFRESLGAAREGWRIRNGVTHAKEYPGFWIPEPTVKAGVAPGWSVKLMFESDDGEYWCERMWVHVTKRRGDRLFGTLDNCPIGLPRLGWGTKVKFHIDDIIDYDPQARDDV